MTGNFRSYSDSFEFSRRLLFLNVLWEKPKKKRLNFYVLYLLVMYRWKYFWRIEELLLCVVSRGADAAVKLIVRSFLGDYTRYCTIFQLLVNNTVCLSVGLASKVPKLTHYWMVWFHPRA